jgi:hypothetical protein
MSAPPETGGRPRSRPESHFRAAQVRTRVVQGAGRCTRGPADWAMVVVLGSELTRYLLRPETQRALGPELQAEIQFGVENSRNERAADILDNIRTFLAFGWLQLLSRGHASKGRRDHGPPPRGHSPAPPGHPARAH